MLISQSSKVLLEVSMNALECKGKIQIVHINCIHIQLINKVVLTLKRYISIDFYAILLGRTFHLFW